jgi:vacuolar-type H+-ATPase subunit D/Vma8
MDREKLQEWKELLLGEIRNLQTQVAPLETELRIRQEKLAAIERLLALEMHPLEAISMSKDSSGSVRMNSKKVADVAYEVLKSADTPMYYRQLYETITQTGFEIHGKDPATNLIAHIGNDPRFERVKRGTYALKEWRTKQKRK